MEHSAVQWIQIPAKKLNRAATFYEEVFSAAFFFEELNSIPHAVFRVAKNGKKLIHGAIIELQGISNTGTGPVLFFDATGNFETILELIKENGGEIIKNKTLITSKESGNSFTIPNTYIDNKPGYYAHFYDSEGNKMGLYGTN
jgi:predicted enzyme related to lactoylglutathione lyase